MRKKITRADIIRKRAHLLKSTDVKSKVRVGDKRISSPTRLCSICGNRLSGMNYTTGKAISKRNHWHLQYNKILYIDICERADSCCKKLGVDKDEGK